MHKSLLLLVMLAVLAPMVQAQGAPEPELSLSTTATTVAVTREEPVLITVEVAFDSENPFDALQPREIRLSTEGAPSGWSVSVSPSVLEMSPGDRESVTVTVTLAGSATQDTASATVRAVLVPRGAEGTPIGGAIDPQKEATLDLDLQREDPLTTEVLDSIGPWIWVVLGVVAVLAVALAVLLSRNNRLAVRLVTDVRSAQVSPGRSVAVPVRVENTTNIEDTVVFHVTQMAEGWAAHLPVPELDLDGKQSEELHLVVTAPSGAKAGDQQSVGISAHSAQAPRRTAELVIDVTVADTPEKKAADATS